MSDHHHQHASAPRALALGLVLTAGFVGVELVAGAVTGSLALVADAGHMMTDATGLALALGAALLARRPADDRRTYGYARLEVLVVPVHVLLLLAIAAYIVYESIGRLGDGHSVDTLPVIATGAAGLLINLVVMRLLHGHAHANLNARAAMFEAVADALGSIGVIASAVAIALGAWSGVDAIVALAIAAFIVPRAVHLLRQAAEILLESAPAGLDPVALASAAREVRGVVDLHDVHVWSIAPAFPALSAHVEMEDVSCAEHVLTDLTALFRDRFSIGHVTLQPETQALHEAIECCLSPDAGRLAEGHRHVSAGL